MHPTSNYKYCELSIEMALVIDLRDLLSFVELVSHCDSERDGCQILWGVFVAKERYVTTCFRVANRGL